MQQENLFLECWFLTGPTAAGKTTVGLELAQRLNAEVVSLDSMAIYRGMDLGTAKPTISQREKVPHHLIDIVQPNQEYSLAQYVEAARACVTDLRGRGREVLFVGGTPLYLKSLLRGIFEGPPADWELRGQLEAELEEVGLAALHERLALVDPLSAAKLHPHDKRRIIRALEVFRLTGQPISHMQMQFDEGLPAERCKVFVLDWPRPLLHRRIEARVDRMFADGLVDEVRSLLEQYGELSRTASQAVGYREVIEHLAGGPSLEETIEQVKVRTRQFARRQETWFRSLSECRPLPQHEEKAVGEIVEEILCSQTS